MCWHNCNAPHMAVVRRRRLSKSRISLHKHLHTPSTAPLLPFLQLQTLFNPTGTYPPSWRWLSCAVLPAIPLDNGGRGRRRTQTHCNTCWCRCSLLSGTDSANFLLLSFFYKVLLRRLPLTNIHPDPHYCEPEDTRALLAARTDFTETLLPLVLSTLYICPLLLFPSLLLLIRSPSPVLSYNLPGLLPLSPFCWVAALTDWQCLCRWMLGMRPRVGPAVTPRGRVSLHSKQALVTYTHAYVQTSKINLSITKSQKTFAIKIHLPFKVMSVY